MGNSGLKFIDESAPEELVNLVSSAYMSLCNSHNLGEASDLSDLERVSAILLQCELDHTGKEKVRLQEPAIRNGLIVIGLIGLAHNLMLWKGLDWIGVLKISSQSVPGEFHKRLLKGLRPEAKSKQRRRDPEAAM